MKQKLLKFTNGSEVLLDGENLEVKIGGYNPDRIIDMDEVEEKEFKKAIDNPEKYKLDNDDKKVKINKDYEEKSKDNKS